MGIFTNYKKKIEEEKQLWENDLEEYNKAINQMKTEIEAACCKYNQEVATINSERSGLKELINKLYHFLKEFGKIGAKITPFDFVNESWQQINIDSMINPEKVAKTSDSGNNDGNKYAWIAVLLTPIAVLPLIPMCLNGENKENYLKYKTKHEEALKNYDNNKEKLNDICKNIRLATDIAKLYYGTIGTVKEAITETVIPELSGIKAFLYACSIADKVAEDRELTLGVEPIDISEIRGTKYNEHYLFIKNTVDYYTLTVKIFTQQVLTKMLEDNEITEEERAAFEKQIKEIEDKQKCMSENALFTKES